MWLTTVNHLEKKKYTTYLNHMLCHRKKLNFTFLYSQIIIFSMSLAILSILIINTNKFEQGERGGDEK